MERLNNAPILDQTEGQRDILMMIAIWKLSGGQVVKIDAETIKAFNAAHNHNAVLLMHGHADSIDIGIITAERAAVLAAHQQATTSTEKH